jgi:hypothetical protein
MTMLRLLWQASRQRKIKPRPDEINPTGIVFSGGQATSVLWWFGVRRSWECTYAKSTAIKLPVLFPGG